MSIKVLTIDDDRSLTDLISMILRNHGMHVTSSNCGAQGIEMARKIKPDIILLDLILPGTDGWEVCKTLRSLTSTPIIILSTLEEPGIISSALDAGADDYLTKPISSNILVALIKNLTRRHLVEINAPTMLREVGVTSLETTSFNLH